MHESTKILDDEALYVLAQDAFQVEIEATAKKWNTEKSAPCLYLQTKESFFWEKLNFKINYFKSNRDAFKKHLLSAQSVRECISERWLSHLQETAREFLSNYSYDGYYDLRDEM